MSTSFYDTHIDRLAAGERLSPDEIRELARTPDILPLGMLADAMRKFRRMEAKRGPAPR